MGKSLIVDREQIKESILEKTRGDLQRSLEKAIERKGGGSFSSVHEIYGALAEEVHEVLEAIHDKDPQAVREELIDIAIVAFWGIASINQKIKQDVEK